MAGTSCCVYLRDARGAGLYLKRNIRHLGQFRFRQDKSRCLGGQKVDPADEFCRVIDSKETGLPGVFVHYFVAPLAKIHRHCNPSAVH